MSDCVDCQRLREYLIKEHGAQDYWLDANGPVQRAIEIMQHDARTVRRLSQLSRENEARKSIITQLQATIEELKSENAAKAAVIHRLMPV